jgi:hypothetical protein
MGSHASIEKTVETFDVITGPGVVIEDAALAQLRQVADLPGCVSCRSARPPSGMHGPVGAAFAFDGIVRPALVR